MRQNAPSVDPLEPRRLFSDVTWNVSINDPGNSYMAYHAQLVAVTQAAGKDWCKLLNTAPAVSIEVQINLVNDIPTANAYSADAVAVGEESGITIYEQGVANELRTGIDPNGLAVDAIMNLSTSFLTGELWFDPGANPASRVGTVPGNKSDAYSTILHEIGHVLAWNGWRDYDTLELPPPGDYQSTFDQRIINFLGDPLFDGENANNLYGGPAPLTSGNIYHLGNEDPGLGSDLLGQLMNGALFQLGTKYDFSPMDIAVLRDVGMPMRVAPPQASSQDDYFTTRSINVSFDAPVRWDLSLADLTLTRLDDSQIITQLALNYDRGTDIAHIGYLPGTLPDGNYRLFINKAGVFDLTGNQLADDYELSFFVLAGDANHDRRVDTRDFNLLAGSFGAMAGMTFANGDFNYDGAVDSQDFSALVGQFGKSVPPFSAPFPAATTALFSESRVDRLAMDWVIP